MSFIQLTSSCIPMPLEHIKISQILPTRFSKMNQGFDLTEKLFYDFRFDENNQLDAAFVLNNPAYAGNVLITGKEFGIGQNAESAILGLLAYGFKAIIASSFASNFKETALKLGLVLIEVAPAFLNHLIIAVFTNPKLQISIDLETQLLEVPELNLEFKFKVNPFQLLCQMFDYPQYDLLSKLEQKIIEA